MLRDLNMVNCTFSKIYGAWYCNPSSKDEITIELGADPKFAASLAETLNQPIPQLAVAAKDGPALPPPPKTPKTPATTEGGGDGGDGEEPLKKQRGVKAPPAQAACR